MNILEIFRSGIPGIEQDGLGLKAFFFKGLAQHIPKMIVFGFTVSLWVVHAKIEGVIIAFMGMDHIDNPDSFHEPMHVSTVLTLHQFNFLRIAFILNAIIQN